MVRASDCGPEGRRFNSDIPPHTDASVVQRLVCKFSKLEMRFRLPPLAPEYNKEYSYSLFFIFIFACIRLLFKCWLNVRGE